MQETEPVRTVRSRREARRLRRARQIRDLEREGRKPWEILPITELERVPGPACVEVEPGRYRVRQVSGAWGEWIQSWKPIGPAIVSAMTFWPSLTMIVDVKGYSLGADQEKAHGGSVFFNPPEDRFPRRKIRRRWDGITPRVVLRGRNPDRTHPIIQGLAWQSGAGVELWSQDIDWCAAEGGSCIIGTPGQVGAIRLLYSDGIPPVDPDQKQSYSGTGANWGTRTYGGFVDMQHCDWLGPFREHARYEQDFTAANVYKSKLGMGGRTNMQGGTRMDWEQPEEYLGYLVDSSELLDVHSGSGGGSAFTCWGYPGPVVVRDTLIRTSEQEHNENRAISVWEAANLGGVADPDGDDAATPLVVLYRITIDAPHLGRSAIELESFAEAYIGSITGNAPTMAIDLGDQYPSGPIGDVTLIDDNVPMIRSRVGKGWDVWSDELRKAHLWSPTRA